MAAACTFAPTHAVQTPDCLVQQAQAATSSAPQRQQPNQRTSGPESMKWQPHTPEPSLPPALPRLPLLPPPATCSMPELLLLLLPLLGAVQERSRVGGGNDCGGCCC